jgi:TetR/AcrR family transcriptional regulator, transcriptional repressor for nem operon
MQGRTALARKGSETRELLLEAAERAVLAKGFAATSIEELIAQVGITKSGFFYHFGDKGGLAKAMMERHLAHDRAILDDVFGRGDALNEDPLHGFLVGLQLFAEMMGQLREAHPGCLAAAFTYQDQQFNREVHELNRQGVLAWRARFKARLELIAERYPPKMPVDLGGLADMASALVEGGLVMGRMLHDPAILPQQIRLYRDFVRAIFLPN